MSAAPAPGRRRVLGALGTAALALALPRAGRAAAAWPRTLRMGMQKTGPLVVLRQQRTLETALAPHGVAVTWAEFGAGPAVMEALNAGAIDFSYVGDAPPVFAQAAGVEFRYVASVALGGGNEGLLVREDSPLRAVTDLKGKRVATTRGSSAQTFLVELLAANGLKPADVQVSFLQPSDAAAAFRQGSLDAWAVWDPFLAVAQAEPGTRTLATGDAVPPTRSFFVATRQLTAQSPDLVRLVVDQLADSGRWCRAHVDELAAIMSQVTGVGLAAQAVAARRGPFGAELMDDAVVTRQQQVADLFAADRLIPGPVRVRDVVWVPPSA